MTATTEFATTENFVTLLDETFVEARGVENSVVKGTIIKIDGDFVIVDVGLKSEGRISRKEFNNCGLMTDIKVGDDVEVFIKRYEDKNGEIILSREKAWREEVWFKLEKSFKDNQLIDGVIFGRVKGGFTVDLSGAEAFLPGSQVDIIPVRDISHLMGNQQSFQILKMDRSRGNIVVSRRVVIEKTRAEKRSELVENLKEGQILEGVVKNITDYGAFLELGGVDGLLHVTDISWKRINHPSEVLSIGQTVKVQIIRFNMETKRISLGIKQLETDPWSMVAQKYQIGDKFIGRVTNITDYGAFIELEAGVEGLVHVSEMSWTKKNIHPNKIVSTSQEVNVLILDIDIEKHRISLGLKQTMINPWKMFFEKFPVDSEIEGEIKNITGFGLFIGLPGEIDGMVHLSDLSWDVPGEQAVLEFKKGDVVKVKVLEIDVEKERIHLGIKQLCTDLFKEFIVKIKKGDIVTCTVTQINENDLNVDVDGLLCCISKDELARDRSDQRLDRFAVGEKIDAKIMTIDKTARKITLSIKAREIDEEKRAMTEFGSSDSGATLGSIFGVAFNRAKEEKLKSEDK
ncbi:MAG: 30S ribosomal protein S1 [Rhodospirillaceae bacterium]|nr:30S ribosomal protein S1 [Rhodospirillaceae bacterium]